MSVATRAPGSLTLGALPRVHLMPAEVGLSQKAAKIRRRLIWVLGFVMVGVLAGTGLAYLNLVGATSDLTTQQARTVALSVEESKYIGVTGVERQISEIASAQPTAVTGEILWQPFVAQLQGTLPAGTAIDQFKASLNDTTSKASGSGLVPDPLTASTPSIATMTITVDSPQASISTWLDNLAKLKGFVQATPGSVALVPQTGHYTVDITLLISGDVVAHRFTTGKK